MVAGLWAAEFWTDLRVGRVLPVKGVGVDGWFWERVVVGVFWARSLARSRVILRKEAWPVGLEERRRSYRRVVSFAL